MPRLTKFATRMLGNSKYKIKGNLLALSFIKVIYIISFPNSFNKTFNIASFISFVYFKRAFLCPIGVIDVAVTLLQLIREVNKDIKNVNRRGGVG